MKYLKTYKESLQIENERQKILKDNDIELTMKLEKLEKSYKEKIDNCIQYLLDSYKYEYIFNHYDDVYDAPTFTYEFIFESSDDKNELIDSISKSFDNLKHELPGCEVGILIYYFAHNDILNSQHSLLQDLKSIKDTILSKDFELSDGHHLEIDLIII